MENKYYTPTLEEFHIGFELELYGSIGHIGLPRKDSVPGWCPSKINTTEDYCMYTSFQIETIRVKYLDREDIESLGFKRIVEYTDTRSGDSFAYEKDGIKIALLMNHKIHIYFEDGTDIFRGTIKNKSELVKLLNQLGI